MPIQHLTDMIASAVAEIDALTEELDDARTELVALRQLVGEMLGIITAREAERDTWRARYEAAK